LVPLDYADPSGPTIELSIVRIAAREKPIGSLFVNPGGPGGSAVDYARVAEYAFGDAVLDSFDIIGLDPRGVGLSSPVKCFTDEQLDELNEASISVDAVSDVQELADEYAEVGELCDANGGPLIDHMSTVESARDLDIARAAVGDSTLNLLGKSYGSAIGGMYLRLFPMNLGRVVLDGVLPVDLDTVEITRTQAEAFEVATADFIDDCVTHSDCPFDSNPIIAINELRDLLSDLDREPLPTKDPERELNGSLASYAVLSYLYFPKTYYPRLRAGLAKAINDGDGTELLTMLDERSSRSPDGEYLDNSSDAYFAVTCLDLPYGGTVDEAIALSDELSVTAPTFGEGLGIGVLSCKDWPAVGPSVPPLPQTTNAPVLIVNPTNDPATPFVWAQRLHDQLPNSRLVSWDTHNHTAYFEGSECVDKAVETFLLSGDAPELTDCVS
jgi:pimeloyl-ACP methyl ester carboxylesterase